MSALDQPEAYAFVCGARCAQFLWSPEGWSAGGTHPLDHIDVGAMPDGFCWAPAFDAGMDFWERASGWLYARPKSPETT